MIGPHLVREPHRDLDYRLGDLWLAVTRDGGAVGFTPDAPEVQVRVAAHRAVAAVRAGREHLLAMGTGPDLVGTVFVVPGDSDLVRHRGMLTRLMVHPGARGQGLGGRLLDAAVAHGRSLGLERLLLSAGSGTRSEGFFVARGWAEVGRWPGCLRVAPGDARDEVWFQRVL